MKAAKTVLALAIMMVVLMPSCTKKEVISISSENPYNAVFATCDYVLGKNIEEVSKQLKKDGWETTSEYKYSKSVGNLNYQIEMKVGEVSNKVGQVFGRIESETGKTDLFSEQNYSNFIVSLDKEYSLNDDECEFQYSYYQVNDEQTSFKSFKDLKKSLKNFTKADATYTQYGTRQPCEFNIHTRFECQRYVFECRLTDTRVVIYIDD